MFPQAIAEQIYLQVSRLKRTNDFGWRLQWRMMSRGWRPANQNEAGAALYDTEHRGDRFRQLQTQPLSCHLYLVKLVLRSRQRQVWLCYHYSASCGNERSAARYLRSKSPHLAHGRSCSRL